MNRLFTPSHSNEDPLISPPCFHGDDSIGSLGKYPNEADVRGITVKNCTLTGTENGVRIKTWPGSPPSAASKLVFNDIVMNNVKKPIIIDQDYDPHNKKQVRHFPSIFCQSYLFFFQKMGISCCISTLLHHYSHFSHMDIRCNSLQITPSRVKISNVHFANIRGTSTSPVAVSLVCSQQVPCEIIQLKNINLRYVGLPANRPITSTCLNTHGLVFEGIQIPPACK